VKIAEDKLRNGSETWKMRLSRPEDLETIKQLELNLF